MMGCSIDYPHSKNKHLAPYIGYHLNTSTNYLREREGRESRISTPFKDSI